MAEQGLNGLAARLPELGKSPLMRQMLLMLGIAASVAVGFGAVLWSRGPDYKVLYASLSPERASAVVDSLTTLGIPYKVEDQTGGILVPAERLSDARLKLASSGLAKGDGSGLEMIDQEKGFAVSEFIEGKKYQHALETELARTIESIHQVRKARVHLAIPKQSVFVRERKPASASIMLDVFPGASIEPGNVKAIVNLVAASIPDLQPAQVTVVDQQGNLLSSPEHEDELALSTRQFGYREHVEKSYEDRIRELLAPIVATGHVKAQVSANIDFTQVEESRESFNPDKTVVRSEQISQSLPAGAGNSQGGATGVPGALSNQPIPMQAQTAPLGTKPGTTPAPTPANPAPAAPGNSEVTRNFEIERTLNHVSTPSGSIRNMSVAVVIDNAPLRDEKGRIVRPAPTAQEVERLTALVKDAIGFDAQRGDRVSLMLASFGPAPAATPEPGFWQEPWFASAVRQGLTGLAVLLVVLLVLRPAIRQLLKAQPVMVAGADGMLSEAQAAGLAGLPAPGQPLALPQGGAMMALPPGVAAGMLENKMNQVRGAVADDPRRVAQVVKSWVTENAG